MLGQVGVGSFGLGWFGLVSLVGLVRSGMPGQESQDLVHQVGLDLKVDIDIMIGVKEPQGSFFQVFKSLAVL